MEWRKNLAGIIIIMIKITHTTTHKNTHTHRLTHAHTCTHKHSQTIKHIDYGAVKVTLRMFIKITSVWGDGD